MVLITQLVEILVEYQYQSIFLIPTSIPKMGTKARQNKQMKKRIIQEFINLFFSKKGK